MNIIFITTSQDPLLLLLPLSWITRFYILVNLSQRRQLSAMVRYEGITQRICLCGLGTLEDCTPTTYLIPISLVVMRWGSEVVFNAGKIQGICFVANALPRAKRIAMRCDVSTESYTSISRI